MIPGNPTRSYRSRDPLRIVGEVTDWTRLTPAALQVWRDRLAAIFADERGEIINYSALLGAKGYSSRQGAPWVGVRRRSRGPRGTCPRAPAER